MKFESPVVFGEVMGMALKMAVPVAAGAVVVVVVVLARERKGKMVRREMRRERNG